MLRKGALTRLYNYCETMKIGDKKELDIHPDDSYTEENVLDLQSKLTQKLNTEFNKTASFDMRTFLVTISLEKKKMTIECLAP